MNPQKKNEKSSFNTPLRTIALVVVQAFILQQFVSAAPDVTPAKIPLFQPAPVHVKFPEAVARIEDSFKSTQSDKTLILIQDAHANESGQINLARTLEQLITEEGLKYVFTEAGSGDDSLTFLKEYGTPEIRKDKGLPYLRKAQIKGTEYLSFTSEKDFVLWGVENKALYLKSLEAYREVAKNRQTVQNYLQKVKITLTALEPKLLNPDLLKFIAAQDAYLKNESSITDHLADLIDLAKANVIPLEAYAHLDTLQRLRDQEAAIDFERAGQEQARAIAALSAEDRKELNAASQNAASTSKLFGENLKEQNAFSLLLKQKITRISEYPELQKYIEYRKAAEKIEAQGILEELKAFESAIASKLARTDDERGMMQARAYHRLLVSLFNLSLTADEYASLKSDFKRYNLIELEGFLNKKLLDLQSDHERMLFLDLNFREIAKKAVEFYELTYERDQVFLKEALSKMDAESQKTAALVTGGYHTSNLRRLLREKGISYISVSPQVYHETDHSRYERLLLNQDILPGERSVDMASAVSIQMNGQALMFFDVDDTSGGPALLGALAQSFGSRSVGKKVTAKVDRLSGYNPSGLGSRGGNSQSFKVPAALAMTFVTGVWIAAVYFALGTPAVVYVALTIAPLGYLWFMIWTMFHDDNSDRNEPTDSSNGGAGARTLGTVELNDEQVAAIRRILYHATETHSDIIGIVLAGSSVYPNQYGVYLVKQNGTIVDDVLSDGGIGVPVGGQIDAIFAEQAAIWRGNFVLDPISYSEELLTLNFNPNGKLIVTMHDRLRVIALSDAEEARIDGILRDAFQRLSQASGARVELRNLKGGVAVGSSERWVDQLLDYRRIAEFSLENGELKLHIVNIHRDTYTKGQTPPDLYRSTDGDTRDMNNPSAPHYFSPEEQEILKQWILAHSASEGPEWARAPRIRIALGQTSLHFQKDAGSSHYLYADDVDNAVYLGEFMLHHLLSEEGAALRQNILEDFLFDQTLSGAEFETALENIAEAAQRVDYERSEIMIRKLSEQYGIPVDANTKISLHVMDPNKLGGSKTYKTNTKTLRSIKVGGSPINAAMLPVGANDKHMHDMQQILAFIRANPRLVGLIPADEFKSRLVNFLDETTPVAKLLGVDPVYKDKDGKLCGTIDLGISVTRWFMEESKAPIQGKKFVMLGAGVTGRSIAYELIQQGAAEVLITDVTDDRLADVEIIKNRLNYDDPSRRLGDRLKKADGKKEVETINLAIENADAVFNATGLGKEPKHLGMAPDAAYTLAREGQYWIDLNYRPRLTLFLWKVRKYGAKHHARAVNAVDITAKVNASHLGYLLEGTPYRDETSPEYVSTAQLDDASAIAWRDELHESILPTNGAPLSPQQERTVPAWHSDGVSKSGRDFAEKMGFEVVEDLWADPASPDPKNPRIRRVYRVKHKPGYTAPTLNGFSLSVIRTAQTEASADAEEGQFIRSGDDPRHATSGLSAAGFEEARNGGIHLLRTLGPQMMANKVIFLRNGMYQSEQTLEEVFASAVRNSKDILGQTVDLRPARVVRAPNTEERFNGRWSGFSLADVRNLLGEREWEIASAVELAHDAFGKASYPAHDSLREPENTVMLINRVREFISYLNQQYAGTGNEIVFFGNSVFLGILQAVMQPELFANDAYIRWDAHLPPRATVTKIYHPQAVGSRAAEIGRILGEVTRHLDESQKERLRPIDESIGLIPESAAHGDLAVPLRELEGFRAELDDSYDGPAVVLVEQALEELRAWGRDLKPRGSRAKVVYPKKDSPTGGPIEAIKLPSKKPKETRRIAIIGGTGAVMTRYYKVFLEELGRAYNVEFIVIGRTMTPEKFEEVKKKEKLPVVEYHQEKDLPESIVDWKKAFGTEPPHGVIVATLTDTHYKFTEWALRNGLTVACEKPAAMPQHLPKLMKLLNKKSNKGKVLWLDHFINSPAMLEALRFLSANPNLLGDIELFKARLVEGPDQSLGGNVRRIEMDADGRSRMWLVDPKRSGGGLYIDMGYHSEFMIHTLCALLGIDFKRVRVFQGDRKTRDIERIRGDKKSVEKGKTTLSARYNDRRLKSAEKFPVDADSRESYLRAAGEIVGTKIQFVADGGKGIDTTAYYAEVIGANAILKADFGTDVTPPSVTVTDRNTGKIIYQKIWKLTKNKKLHGQIRVYQNGRKVVEYMTVQDIGYYGNLAKIMSMVQRDQLKADEIVTDAELEFRTKASIEIVKRADRIGKRENRRHRNKKTAKVNYPVHPLGKSPDLAVTGSRVIDEVLSEIRAKEGDMDGGDSANRLVAAERLIEIADETHQAGYDTADHAAISDALGRLAAAMAESTDGELVVKGVHLRKRIDHAHPHGHAAGSRSNWTPERINLLHSIVVWGGIAASAAVIIAGLVIGVPILSVVGIGIGLLAAGVGAMIERFFKDRAAEESAPTTPRPDPLTYPVSPKLREQIQSVLLNLHAQTLHGDRAAYEAQRTALRWAVEALRIRYISGSAWMNNLLMLEQQLSAHDDSMGLLGATGYMINLFLVSAGIDVHYPDRGDYTPAVLAGKLGELQADLNDRANDDSAVRRLKGNDIDQAIGGFIAHLLPLLSPAGARINLTLEPGEALPNLPLPKGDIALVVGGTDQLKIRPAVTVAGLARLGTVSVNGTTIPAYLPIEIKRGKLQRFGELWISQVNAALDIGSDNKLDQTAVFQPIHPDSTLAADLPIVISVNAHSDTFTIKNKTNVTITLDYEPAVISGARSIAELEQQLKYETNAATIEHMRHQIEELRRQREAQELERRRRSKPSDPKKTNGSRLNSAQIQTYLSQVNLALHHAMQYDEIYELRKQVTAMQELYPDGWAIYDDALQVAAELRELTDRLVAGDKSKLEDAIVKLQSVAESVRPIGEGYDDGRVLDNDRINAIVEEALSEKDWRGKRVLINIPDMTRTAAGLDRIYQAIQSGLLARGAAKVDVIVAQGTHRALTWKEKNKRLGIGWFTRIYRSIRWWFRIHNHAWNDPNALQEIGTIPASEIKKLTDGRFEQAVPVTINRKIYDYDHVMVLGPVYPHEVAGMSGFWKYLFPGIAGKKILDFFHWLGAVITNAKTIGNIDTPVRKVIHAAARLIQGVEKSAFTFVDKHGEVAALHYSETAEGWKQTAKISQKLNTIYLDEPVDHMIAVIDPKKHDELWTALKGFYKGECGVADGGELILYAPGLHKIHDDFGADIMRIGYHTAEYFLANWEQFKDEPWAVLAHLTHGKGLSKTRGEEDPRIQSTLATAFTQAETEQLNLGFVDWRTLEALVAQHRGEANADNYAFFEYDGKKTLIVYDAGEKLFKIRKDKAPDWQLSDEDIAARKRSEPVADNARVVEDEPRLAGSRKPDHEGVLDITSPVRIGSAGLDRLELNADGIITVITPSNEASHAFTARVLDSQPFAVPSDSALRILSVSANPKVSVDTWNGNRATPSTAIEVPGVVQDNRTRNSWFELQVRDRGSELVVTEWPQSNITISYKVWYKPLDAERAEPAVKDKPVAGARLVPSIAPAGSRALPSPLVSDLTTFLRVAFAQKVFGEAQAYAAFQVIQDAPSIVVGANVQDRTLQVTDATATIYAEAADLFDAVAPSFTPFNITSADAELELTANRAAKSRTKNEVRTVTTDLGLQVAELNRQLAATPELNANAKVVGSADLSLFADLLSNPALLDLQLTQFLAEHFSEGQLVRFTADGVDAETEAALLARAQNIAKNLLNGGLDGIRPGAGLIGGREEAPQGYVVIHYYNSDRSDSERKPNTLYIGVRPLKNKSLTPLALIARVALKTPKSVEVHAIAGSRFEVVQNSIHPNLVRSWDLVGQMTGVAVSIDSSLIKEALERGSRARSIAFGAMKIAWNVIESIMRLSTHIEIFA